MVISKLVRPPPLLSQCKIPSISLRNVDIFQYTLGGYILRAGGNLRLKTLKSNIFIKFGYDVKGIGGSKVKIEIFIDCKNSTF